MTQVPERRTGMSETGWHREIEEIRKAITEFEQKKGGR